VALTAVTACCSDDSLTAVAPSTATACTTAPDPRIDAKIDKLRGHVGAKGLVRAIVTVRVNPSCPGNTQQSLSQAFRDVGCELVDPLPATPLIVVECTLDQLRTVASKGLVADIRLDQAS
jgi:hypothetical protein